jgi:hypothetical protein
VGSRARRLIPNRPMISKWLSRYLHQSPQK